MSSIMTRVLRIKVLQEHVKTAKTQLSLEWLFKFCVSAFTVNTVFIKFFLFLGFFWEGGVTGSLSSNKTHFPHSA